MIITFPMLVSQSVSENAIPGIAKTIEGYLIINHMSDIMDDPNVVDQQKYKRFKTTKKGWYAREGLEISEQGGSRSSYMPPGSGTKSSQDAEEERVAALIRVAKARAEKAEADAKKAEAEAKKAEAEKDEAKARAAREKQKSALAAAKEERDKEKDAREKARYAKEREEERKREEEEELRKQETRATAKIRLSDYKSISLEPSYVEVEVTLESGIVRREMVGIKVIPLRVMSSEKLSRLIMYDFHLNTLRALVVQFGRGVVRSFWRLIDKWTGRVKDDMTITGDPRRDIIMARVGGKSKLGIVVLDKNEDLDERFFSNIPRVKRLFKLGWGNIVVVDNIARNAYFCMRSYAGVCQVMNFAMMYQTLGQLKVYDSLEDAQRQNSSLFKIRKSASKVFSEWITETRLSKYYNEDKKNEIYR